ncbi:hypothetical protein D3C78_1511380 [compost metagenome]
MITDETIDQTILELARTMKALKVLKATRKGPVRCINRECTRHGDGKPFESTLGQRCYCGHILFPAFSEVKEHAAAKRASIDLTRKLADLRAGR